MSVPAAPESPPTAVAQEEPFEVVRPAASRPVLVYGLASGMTRRAIGLGLILSVWLSWWTCHSAFVARSSYLTITHLPIAALFPFIIVVFVLNGMLKRFIPRQTLTPPELIIVFFTVFTSSAIPAWAFSTYWIAVPSMPFYYATPENRWETLFFQYLPDWLVVQDVQDAVRWFYEGLPLRGGRIPWQAWVVPMGWWATFFLALFFVSASAMVILRKQWIERERLTFPLAKVPLMLVEESERPSVLPRIAQNRLFWFGCCFAFGVLAWNAIAFFKAIPPIPLGAVHASPISLARAFPNIQVQFNFAVISIGFFTDLNILLSIWVFFLVSTIQIGIMNRIGVPGTNEVVVAQHLGGLFVYTLFGLWMARRHLRDVFRKALGRAPEVDDSMEFFSYRTAVLGLLIGLLYMIFFLRSAGMSYGVILLLLTSALLLYLGVTRVVAESGLIFLDLPYNAQDFTVFSLGSANLPRADLTMLTLCQTFSRNWRTLGMCAMAHLNKVGEETGGTKRGTFSLIVTALGLAAVTSVIYTIYLGYATNGGASDFADAFGNARAGYDALVSWIQNKKQLTGAEFLGLGAGAVIGWLLILGHHNFPWWPLHPIGFGVARTWGTTMVACSIFLVWLVKMLLLRFGGTRLYRQAQPFFIGMLVGYVLGVALSYGVDLIWFPNSGHVVETW
ncbi:MAG: hypothetical protein HY710_02530 [Candidatus Latescibacteria bacterium]|nr:hypothetical protein [Candidatus Latescibacterota bacterium]